MSVDLTRGTVVLIELDPTVGHEQQGLRPCVVVSSEAVNRVQRYPLIAVVPLTSTPGEGVLYPRLSSGKSGLAHPSYALVDQVRSVDKRRVRRVSGSLPADQLAEIDLGLQLFLGL